MKEAGYPILYHFNLILEVFSHFAPDVIHRKLGNLRDSPKDLLLQTVPRIKGCQLEAFGARGCGGVKMLFVLLTINGNDLCETSRNRNPECEPVGFVFKASLELKRGIPIEPS